MERLPKELRAQLPRLGMTAGTENPLVWARLFKPLSGWNWYLIELEPVGLDAIVYVYEVGWDEALTYFNWSDLDLHAAEVGEPNQLDTTFTPRRLSEVQAQERGNHKFPLGKVVATPGVLAALQTAGQSPLEFLKRHAQGDWGDLDEHDVQENEFSLTRGFRLLSRYTLTDGTVIYLITEADRSITTLLLSHEY